MDECWICWMNERGMTPGNLRLGIQVLRRSDAAHAEQAYDGNNRNHSALQIHGMCPLMMICKRSGVARILLTRSEA
jgi:hypothetical protein